MQKTNQSLAKSSKLLMAAKNSGQIERPDENKVRCAAPWWQNTPLSPGRKGSLPSPLPKAHPSLSAM